MPNQDPPMSDFRPPMDELIQALNRLVEVLKHDPESQWLMVFAEALDDCRRLGPEAPPDDSRALASRLLRLFGGAGSFGDYAPVRPAPGVGWQVIPGMEELDAIAEEVQARALALHLATEAS